MIIRNFLGVPKEAIQRLEESFKKLPLSFYPFVPPIEIRQDPREVHSEEEIKKIQKERPDYNPDHVEGEYANGVIVLYHLAFKRTLRRAEEVLFHEIGHSVFYGLKVLGWLSIDEWNKARELDKNLAVSRRNYKHLTKYERFLEERYGFYHKRTEDEQFAETFRCFFLNHKPLWKYFPHRLAFFKKLTEFLKNKVYIFQ